jgi:hypothetical protein
MGSLFSIPLPLLILSLGFSIGLCVHVVRTGQDSFWLWIILMFQGIGGLAYLAIIVIPGLFGGQAARALRKNARAALDPHRAYREARAAADDSPTVYNRMKLAAAAAALGRHDEAEALYRDAAQGIHAEDPALLLGRAQALVELGRYEEALQVLQVLGEVAEGGRTAQAALAMGRALQGLGRMREADTAYQWAAGRLPGLEGLARYAAFLRATGRDAEADEALAEIDRRAAKATAKFRKEAQGWRDLAARG